MLIITLFVVSLTGEHKMAVDKMSAPSFEACKTTSEMINTSPPIKPYTYARAFCVKEYGL